MLCLQTTSNYRRYAPVSVMGKILGKRHVTWAIITDLSGLQRAGKMEVNFYLHKSTGVRESKLGIVLTQGWRRSYSYSSSFTKDVTVLLTSCHQKTVEFLDRRLVEQ